MKNISAKHAGQKSASELSTRILLITTPVIWLTIFSQLDSAIETLANNYLFFFLGIVGAIIANSTGAGGGIVFIPAFNHLGMTPDQTVGTSIGIQCFGMTAGCIAWGRYYLRDKTMHEKTWYPFLPVLKITALPAVVGMILSQYLPIDAPGSVNTVFSLMSMVFGIIVLLTTVLYNDDFDGRRKLNRIDIMVLPIVAFVGAMVTSWVSVGIGEFIAVFLILRRYSAIMAVAVAVCISSITVLSGVFHETTMHNIQWEIILFAAPAAVLGGILARKLACFIKIKWLKVVFGVWIIFVGLVG